MVIKVMWCYSPKSEFESYHLPIADRVWGLGGVINEGAWIDTYKKYMRFRRNRKKAIDNGEIAERRAKWKKGEIDKLLYKELHHI